MKAAEALAQIQGLAVLYRYRVTRHARQRMVERGVLPEDLHNALRLARRAQQQAERDTWKMTGPDEEGDDLDVIVVLEGDALVVTVF